MIKKGTSKQNVAIIVLIVLLLLSITFGATYSYFNGSTNPINSGSITTAILEIGLTGEETNPDGVTIGTERQGLTIVQGKVVPGQPLVNTALSIYNYSQVETYMMLVFSFTARNAKTGEIVDTTNLDVLDIREGSTAEGWVKNTYVCKDGVSKIFGVVYLGKESGDFGYGVIPRAQVISETQNYSVLEVLNPDCLQAPTSWGNSLQGCELTFNFVAYAIQSEAISEIYPGVANADPATRRSAIAQAIIELNGLDLTTASQG